jgi:hypothetical protein
MTECVLCDWVMDWTAPPWCVYQVGTQYPLTWKRNEIEPSVIHLSDLIADTLPGIALVHHWSQAHPSQLRALVGPVEIDVWPRTSS